MNAIKNTADNAKNTIKVKDLENIIQLIKKLYLLQPNNSKMVIALDEFVKFLRPHRSKDAIEFIELLSISIGNIKKTEKIKKTNDLKNVSYENFVKYREEFNKEEIIYLANRFFKISMSRMQKLGKKDVLELVNDSIINRDTLDAIGRRASER